ncbi:hypothetical protein [Micromonospora sp. AKA38]|nr:hypothetical protein [Micromonospora sp. AKA38]GHJ13224.1 hypothetical protein TPA0908_12190 [Micromonospora sp. AKA38]
MPRWKWFQRENEPVDVVQPATAYPDRAGAHAKQPEASHKREVDERQSDGGCERLA